MQAAEKKKAQDKERAVGSSSGGVDVEVFLPACTSDMSVLDVLVHKMGARAAKIRLDKLKESENDAGMSVYPDIFGTPYDDESPEDKATREEEEKEEAELKEAEEVMWSSFSVGGGLFEELAVGDIHVFPMETSTFDERQS